MKLFHTADWHLGKLIHGVYMTEDQAYILDQFLEAIQEEKPDAVIIAGDLYDRAIPPTEAVDLLNKTLKKIVIDLETPVLAISGNHDSPDRIHFGSELLKRQGLHIIGQFQYPFETVKLSDAFGEVHFHLIPYAEPSIIRHVLQNEDIHSHDDAMHAVVNMILESMDKNARHIFVGHAFVTPFGEEEENTSDAERPLSIGGADYVNSAYFAHFHYTALGHLHQAHFVSNETIRYAGSPLCYSISEEKHKKGFYVVDLGADGNIKIEKRILSPIRNMRTVEGMLDDILQHDISDDYVFIRLLNENPVLQPMEKIRSVYPNAMHVERVIKHSDHTGEEKHTKRQKLDDLGLLEAFYKAMKGTELSENKRHIFQEILEELQQQEEERQ